MAACAYIGNGMDDFPCIVSEIGSFSTKIGYAGEDYPRCVLSSTSAVYKNDYKKRSFDFLTRPLPSLSEQQHQEKQGEEQSLYDENWEIENPVDMATGWIVPTTVSQENQNSNNNNHHHRLQHSICSSYLKYGCTQAGMIELQQKEQEEEEAIRLPLLFIERSYNPPPLRQTLIEELFEEQNVPATFLARDAVCACYGVGRTTATVVDIGYRGTTITPVFDGFVENKGILQSPVGGKMMDEIVLHNLDTLFHKDWMKKQHKASSSLNNMMMMMMDPSQSKSCVVPLYQTRMPAHTKRKDLFHQLARLDLARQCKEEGSGAGVGPFGYCTIRPDDIQSPPNIASGGLGSSSSTTPAVAASTATKELHQQYANAPKTPYKLPDGTILHISQTVRFDVVEYLFGNHPTQIRKRQDGIMIMQQGIEEWKNTCKSFLKGSSNSSSSSTTTTTTHLNATSKPRGASFPSSSFYKAWSPYLNPSTMGEFSSLPIPNMLCDSVYKCDVDQQPQLLGNVVLCGGGSCFTTSAPLHSTSVTVDVQQNSMPERLREEVEAIIHIHTPGWRVKVSSPGITERAICSWLGGSILGSLGTFHEMWITKKEYEEHGSSIVHRKCP